MITYKNAELIIDKYDYCTSMNIGEYKNIDFLMYQKEIIEILSCLNKDKVMLEWGCGGSTLFFSQYCKNLYSIESNRSWYTNIKNKLEKSKYENVKIIHESGEKYTKSVDEINEIFDVVFIDGIYRGKCLNYLVKSDKINENTIIFIHDSLKYKNQIINSIKHFDIQKEIKVFWKPEPDGKEDIEHMIVLKRKKNV